MHQKIAVGNSSRTKKVLHYITSKGKKTYSATKELFTGDREYTVKGPDKKKEDVDMEPIERRSRGYVLRFITQVINGDDTGVTLTKGGLVIAAVFTGLTVAALAPYIFAGGILGIALYVGVAMKDEYDRNKAEQARIDQIKNFDSYIKFITKQLFYQWCA